MFHQCVWALIWYVLVSYLHTNQNIKHGIPSRTHKAYFPIA